MLSEIEDLVRKALMGTAGEEENENEEGQVQDEMAEAMAGLEDDMDLPEGLIDVETGEIL